MLVRWICLILLTTFVYANSQEKFLYISAQVVTIEKKTIVEFGVSLTTQANQYLSEAVIKTTLSISQNTSYLYNILYFTQQTPIGQQCYQNWIVNNSQLPTNLCSSLVTYTEQNLPSCMNFTGCLEQNISFTLHLSEQLYKEAVIMIDNTGQNQIILETEVKMELSSQNTWFYWGVGLTCLLLISLVVYAGIIFYWMLKYKKVKKMFEQFKLTEQQQSIKKQK